MLALIAVMLIALRLVIAWLLMAWTALELALLAHFLLGTLMALLAHLMLALGGMNRVSDIRILILAWLEEKFKQKLKRLPVFSQIMEETTHLENSNAEKLSFINNYQMI